MKLYEKYDKLITGLISGFILPFLVGLIVYAFSSGSLRLIVYLNHVAQSDILVSTISFSVFPNIIIFLLFNRFDMLQSSRGVLYVTIFWAVIVFGIKIFG